MTLSKKITSPYKSIWVTKNDGIMVKKGDGVYSNEDFVSSIVNDNSPMSMIMRSAYPSTLTVKKKGAAPVSWKRWYLRDIKNSVSLDDVDMPDELDYTQRMWTSRGELFSRARITIDAAGLTLVRKSIKFENIPNTQDDALTSIIVILYNLVERNTTASLKDRSKAILSSDRRKKFVNVMNSVANGDVMNVALLSANSEPSKTAILWFYYLGSIYGIRDTHEFVNTTYRRLFPDQIEQVHRTWDEITAGSPDM